MVFQFALLLGLELSSVVIASEVVSPANCEVHPSDMFIGVVLFIRFLRDYPISAEGTLDGNS